MNDKEELIYSRAIKAFGIEHQKMMLIEEASELVKELVKEYRLRVEKYNLIQSKAKSLSTEEFAELEKENTNKIIEEIVDVQIVLDQMKLIYCSEIKLYKMVRREKLIKLQQKINKTIEKNRVI